MSERLSAHIPTPEERRKEKARSLAALLGREGTDDDLREIESSITTLRTEIENTPVVGRMLEHATTKRNEFVIPVTSREQKDALLEALFAFGIYPWEEAGLLIVDKKTDLQKLDLAGITKDAEYQQEKPKTETVVGPDVDSKRFAYPLPAQEPIERRKQVPREIIEEFFNDAEQDPGVDKELLEITRKFDAGILDDDDPEFVRTFGEMPTLTLFPHMYVWDRATQTHKHARTGEIFNADAEKDLLQKAKDGDAKAMEIFIRMHVGFVLFFARRVHERFGGDIDDIFQNGLLGLEYAIKNHDPEKSESGKFTSYASRCVEGYMRKDIVNMRQQINMKAKDRLPAIYRLRNEEDKRKQLGGPTYDTEENRLKRYHLERLEKAFLISAKFDPIEEHTDDDAWQSENLSEKPGQMERVDEERLRERFNEVLSTLKPQEELVIRLRYGLGGHDHMEKVPSQSGDSEGYTLQAIGDMIGVSGNRVSQIEAKAIRKMRHSSRNARLYGFIPRWGEHGYQSPEDQPIVGPEEENASGDREFPDYKSLKIGFRKEWTSPYAIAQEFGVTPQELEEIAAQHKAKHPEWINDKGELHEDLVEHIKENVVPYKDAKAHAAFLERQAEWKRKYG